MLSCIFVNRGSDDHSLWYFSVKHSVWLYNRLPRNKSGITPLEFLTKTKSDHCNLLRCRVWGCPVFVLEPKFKNDQNLPKWNLRACLGQFWGFSGEHSSLVENVLHLITEYISPQFHLVFENLFETVIFTRDYEIVFNAIVMIYLN